jgi:hypothetical protein
MKYKILICFVPIGLSYAAAPVPSPADQQQAWQSSVNAASSMNNSGVGNIGFNNFTDINSGMTSLNSQIGASTMNIAKQSVDGSGQANSTIKNQYTNAGNDSNYLYNQGQAGITKCKTQNDPACNAVTRYNDDSVQASLNQYNMGTNAYAYNMYVTPDPSNATCSIIHSYAPLNSQTVQCVSGRNSQVDCTTIITPYSNYVPPVPPDGSSLTSGYAQETSKTFCAITVGVYAYENLTKQSMISVVATSRNDDGGWNETHTFNLSMNSGGYQFAYQNNNNGNTNKTMVGSVNSATCNGSSCSISLTTQCNHGQLGGNDWNRSATTTVYYTKPKVSSVDNGFSITDQCAPYK